MHSRFLNRILHFVIPSLTPSSIWPYLMYYWSLPCPPWEGSDVRIEQLQFAISLQCSFDLPISLGGYFGSVSLFVFV